MNERTLAARLRRGEPDALARALAAPLCLRPDNFVARPWGGRGLFAFKGLEPPPGGAPYGECFEVSGDRRDPESAAHPSTVVLADRSELPLPDLLEVAGEAVLGRSVFAEEGPHLPLLPKLLDVRALLSLQAHPPGNPEAYYILEADPGATLRLGFVRPLEAGGLRETFKAGREAQESLLEVLHPEADPQDLQEALARALPEAGGADALLAVVRPFLAPGADPAGARTLLSCLAGAWRQILGLLTEVPAVPGTMLLNATPDGVSAEAHALGNPEGRAVLLFEIRRPAPTWRAWDHVRFPLRTIEVDRALDVLSLDGRSAASFAAEPKPVADRAGVWRSVAGPAFVVDHLRPTGSGSVDLPPDPAVRTIHVVRGRVSLRVSGTAVDLARGRSAVLPAALGPLAVEGLEASSEALVVSLPDGGAR